MVQSTRILSVCVRVFWQYVPGQGQTLEFLNHRAVFVPVLCRYVPGQGQNLASLNHHTVFVPVVCLLSLNIGGL